MRFAPTALVLSALLLAACPQADPEPDAGSGNDDATVADASSADVNQATLQEQEPNNGATVDEFDALPLDTTMLGALQQSEDVDIFRFDAVPGQLYEVTLTPAAGSSLQPHLTVMDPGDATSASGDDYVKIVRAPQGAVAIELFAMGHSSYFVVVRDARNVGGAGGAGGIDHGYELIVSARAPSDAASGTIVFPATEQGALDHAGAIALYDFEGTLWTDVLFDLQASGDMDGRLFIYSAEEQDWIARNDNRALGDPDPLIDAPLTADGAMFLVVENIEEQATSLGYTLAASLP